jgi:ADP-ribosylglycohydrolase
MRDLKYKVSIIGLAIGDALGVALGATMYSIQKNKIKKGRSSSGEK